MELKVEVVEFKEPLEITEDKTIYRIYKLTSPQSEKCYVGSTKHKLDLRHALHRTHYKQYNIKHDRAKLTAFEVLKYNDSIIELIEETDNKEKAGELEKKYIEELKTVNKNKPTISPIEKRERIHKYQKEYQKKYRIENPIDQKGVFKKRYENEEFKKKHLEYVKTKFYCEDCGHHYTRNNKLRHHRTPFHIKRKSEKDNTIIENINNGIIENIITNIIE